jgi:outer membrane protein TolC
MSFFKIALIILFTMVTSTAIGQNPDSLLVLDDLLAELIVRNPALRSRENAVLALQQTIPQQSSLPDPMLSLGILNVPSDTYDLSSDPMSQTMIALSQQFPFFGKLSLREEIARKEYLREQQNLLEMKLDLLGQLKQEYFELVYIVRSLQISRETLQLLVDFVSITKTRYSVGKGIQQDVLRSELERLRLEKTIIILQQKQQSSQARINTLLNYPPDRALANPRFYEITFNSWTTSELESLAVRNNPLLAEAQLAVEQGKISRDLAEKEYWPDFSLEFNYGQRNKYPDMLSGILSVNIPLYAANKQSKKVEEETLAVRAVADMAQQQKNDLLLQIKLVRDRLTRDTKMIRLYKQDILPQAELSLESAIAAYKTDRVDFMTLLNNQTSLFEHRLDFLQAWRDYSQNIADLEKLCATSLINYGKNE